MLLPLSAFPATELGAFETFWGLNRRSDTKKEVGFRSIFIKIAWILEFIPQHKAFLQEPEPFLIETQLFKHHCS